VLEGIPQAMPALALADKTVTKAVNVGVTPTVTGGIGDRILGLVVEAGALGEDPEQALRDAVRRLADDVRAAESG
jgi:XTP/dITP diphosphohydrolase